MNGIIANYRPLFWELIPFSHSWGKQTLDHMLLNVPDEKDVCRQLLDFRAINRALITLANENQSSENKLVITEEFIFDQNKLSKDPNNHFNPLLHRLFLDHDIIFYFWTKLKKIIKKTKVLNTVENIMENWALAPKSKCSIFHSIFKYIFQRRKKHYYGVKGKSEKRDHLKINIYI